MRFKASRAEIDDLDGRAALLPEQNVFRLHVAVNDVLLEHDPHALEYGVGESPHQVYAEALVVVLLDELIQVDSINISNNNNNKNEIFMSQQYERSSYIYSRERLLYPRISKVMHKWLRK